MAEKRIKRPRDPVHLAKLVGDIATGQTVEQEASPRSKVSSAAKEARCVQKAELKLTQCRFPGVVAIHISL
jgi:TATA-binding protein-associated factor Taf7